MKNNEYPSRIDFDSWQEGFAKKLRLTSGQPEYGLVKRGFSLSVDENILKCSGGLGFSSSGDEFFIEEKKDIEINIDINKNFFIYLELEDNNQISVTITDDDNNLLYSGYKYLEKQVKLRALEVDYNKIPENPYSADICTKKSVLAIGFFENGLIYELNRKYQESNLAKGEVGLYFHIDPFSFTADPSPEKQFRDYVTVRGCVIEKDLVDRFIKFSKTPGQKGGNSKPELTPSQMPSFGDFPETNTSSDGDHRHQYNRYKYLNNGYRRAGGNLRLPHIWAKERRSTTTKETYYENYKVGSDRVQRHFHNLKSINYINNYQYHLNIEPPFVPLIPIRRVQ